MSADLRASLPSLGRRALLAAGAGLLVLGATRGAGADRRLPLGGQLALRVPWPLGAVDPHRLDDPAAALFAGALFDSLYTPGENGTIVPALAEGDPVLERGEARVTVRGGLLTARERPIEAREVSASLGRARGLGARGWLAEVPPPRVEGRFTLVFALADGAKLARALASPLTAVVPAGFSPSLPDGTGPFRAEVREGALAFTRNPRAARGPSLLDGMTVRSSSDLAASLRAFETGADDLGWLGSGLHEPRAFAKPFDLGAVGWAVLRTGRDAGSWDAPGVAQRLCDGIPPERLSYLVLGAPWAHEAEQGWGGAPCDLLVRDDAPWLLEMARALAAFIDRPGHTVTVRPIGAVELAQRRITRSYALALDVVRPLGPGALGAFLALATADDPSTVVDIAKHAPRLPEGNARALPRTMHLGIVGEIRAQGARLAEVGLPPLPGGVGGIDFGLLTRQRRGA